MAYSCFQARTSPRRLLLLACCCALLVALGPQRPKAAQTACQVLYDGQNGWSIHLCPSDSAITTPMQVALDGVGQGMAARIEVAHMSQGSSGAPRVAVIYASGFARLKQNADPLSALPFGSSFVLGPAYWPVGEPYRHSPCVSS